jgi:hypothetical protein
MGYDPPVFSIASLGHLSRMNTFYWFLGAAALLTVWLVWRRVRTVPVTIDLERSHDTFYAHVLLPDGVVVNEGDEVRVHKAPKTLNFGEKYVMESTATVSYASWPRRVLQRVLGVSEITSLYEVGFEG